MSKHIFFIVNVFFLLLNSTLKKGINKCPLKVIKIIAQIFVPEGSLNRFLKRLSSKHTTLDTCREKLSKSQNNCFLIFQRAQVNSRLTLKASETQLIHLLDRFSECSDFGLEKRRKITEITQLFFTARFCSNTNR